MSRLSQFWSIAPFLLPASLQPIVCGQYHVHIFEGAGEELSYIGVVN